MHPTHYEQRKYLRLKLYKVFETVTDVRNVVMNPNNEIKNQDSLYF